MLYQHSSKVLHSLIQRFVIRILHHMTAKAFQVPWKFHVSWKPAKTSSMLQNYALFTQEQLRQLSKEEIRAVQKRMYQISRCMGTWIRRLLFIRTDKQARRVVFWLYRNICIDLSGPCPGSITVNSCYFSQYYTPYMCRVISAMDKGIFSGIFGGGSLSFEERITEGHTCCSAVFEKELL